MDVENKCRIDYQYRLSEKGPMISKTISSNIVSTQIIENTLEIRKYVNKKETCYFDILTYTIVISNISSFTIKNIFLQDYIEKNTRFIKNSLRIDGNNILCVNPEDGLYIGDLSRESKVTIVFKVLVLPIGICRSVKNSANMKYDYIYNIETPPIRVNKESNNIYIKCEKKLFAQILVSHLLKTSNCIDRIIKAKYKLKILDTRLISSHEINKCKVLVIGKIECRIWYQSRCNKYIEDVFGFSTCMLVPVGIVCSNKNQIKGTIEYVTTDLINTDEIFINASLLLYY